MPAVRRFRLADAEEVWRLHNAALHAAGAHAGSGEWDADVRDIPGAYLDAGGEFLVVEEAGRIVAMGGLSVLEGGVGAIRRMRVDPARQRCGYGSAVLEALEQRARELGLVRLTLDTTTLQTPAQRFYESHGYRRVGRGRYGRFELILYAKNLTREK